MTVIFNSYSFMPLITKNYSMFVVQARLEYAEQKTTQVYAQTVAFLSSKTGEKTASIIFKDSRLINRFF